MEPSAKQTPGDPDRPEELQQPAISPATLDLLTENASNILLRNLDTKSPLYQVAVCLDYLHFYSRQLHEQGGLVQAGLNSAAPAYVISLVNAMTKLGWL